MGQHSHVVLRNLRLLHRSGICPVELTPGRPWTAVGGSWRPWSAVDGHGRPTLPYVPLEDVRIFGISNGPLITHKIFQ